MSETTRKLRDVVIYSDSVIRVRDLAADAIEAVEARVAEAVARVAALERRHDVPAPVRRFKVGDRVRFVAEPKWVNGYLGALGTIERIPGEATLAYYIASDVRGTNGDHVSANDADLEPAPTAVPAPRGFREGDICRVIESKRTKENFLVGCEGRINPYRGSGGDWVIDCGTAKGVRCFYNSELTLVRAADAPEAPAEEDTGLVVQRIRDEATKPLHVEIEKLRGEVARLTAERDEAQGASILNANAVRLQKARAEAAEKELAEARAISAPTAERVRNETQIATELRKDLADANGARDRLVRELSGERVERDYWKTRAEDVTKERDALRAELNTLKAKPRFRTRAVTAADVRALDDEWAKSKYGGRDSWSQAMNAVGLRRRVEQSK